jgi:hypothetical protein
MTVNKQKVENLFADPFLGTDVNLDLSSFPQLTEPPTEDQSYIDDRFGGLVLESRNSLKQGIISMVNREKDAEISGSLKRAGLIDLDEPHTFYTPNCDRAVIQRDRSGAWSVTVFEGGRQKTVKVDGKLDRESAQFKALEAYEANTVRIKDLSKEDEIALIRMILSGNIQSAAETYLHLRLGESNPTDPRFVEITNECAFFCFFHSTPAYSDDAKPFMTNFLRGREVISLPLLRESFSQYQKNQGRLMPFRSEPQESPAESEEINFENLSDDEIETLKNQTMLHQARTARGRR